MMMLWWGWTLLCLAIVLAYTHRFFGRVFRWLPLLCAICVLRWMIVPFDAQDVVGHSVQYLDVFNGQVPSIGDSTFYPSLQIVWYLFGRLSSDGLDPRVFSSVAGGLSILFLTLKNQDRNDNAQYKIAWFTLGWLVFLPELLFWSHSMYNVIFPFLMLCIGIRLAEEQRWVGLSAAMALAVAWRLETVLFWGYLLFYLPIWDWRVMLRSLLGTCGTLVLLSSMSVPGQGEYWDSIAYNWWLVDFYYSYVWALAVGLLLMRKSTVPLVGWSLLWLLGHHVALSTFNDFSSRHVLVTAAVVSQIWTSVWRENRSMWVKLLFLSAIGGNGYDLWQQQGKMKSDETAFIEEVRTGVSVPSLTLTQAHSRGCAWIVEVEPLSFHATQPTRSHFNLLDSREVHGLLLEYGCVDWCYTIQDWAWTELGVQDRAVRIEQMFEWAPVAMIKAGDAECLLRTMKVGTSTDLDFEHTH